MSGQRSARPTPAGAHFLSPRLAARLVREASVEPNDLVFDLGAGGGAITAPLAAAGARVIAVERDARAAAKLTRRFAGDPAVRVVAGDICAIPLPRRPFRVVANVPFGVTTTLLRRLLGSSLVAGDLVLADGVVRAVTAPAPRNVQTLRWSLRFSFGRGLRLPARSFSPPPSVDARVLVIRRRELLGSAGERQAYLALVDAAYRRPAVPWERGGLLTHRQARAVARERRLEPGRAARDLTAADWAAAARVLARR
ncbi:MAG TPA: rRNA adenine N-6-methyltransferase family protein [Mycobacteriales bacterium]|nr:rRNA adenine N-6-methyltransferase family protein [Mycobacteriales bacterium]